jgi:hypothetical protein
MKKAVKKALVLALAAALALGGTQTSVAAATSSPTTTVTTVKQNDVVASKSSTGITATVDTKKDGTAKLETIKKTTKKTVTINSTVKVDGVKYTVTTIGDNAFKNATKATTIVVPKTITKVNAKAFSSLSKTVKTIQFNTTKAPTVSKTAFKGTSTKKMTIKVSSKMSAKELKKFKKALKAAGFKGTVKQSK